MPGVLSEGGLLPGPAIHLRRARAPVNLRQGSLRKMKTELEVVIVDDEPPVVDILSNFVLIAAPNAHIHGFSDPLAARSYILANRVDLLITDHIMPKLDGILLAEATPKHVRKVVVSGYVSKISGEELKDLNAVVIAKPASMKVIAGIVSEEMGKVGI